MDYSGATAGVTVSLDERANDGIAGRGRRHPRDGARRRAAPFDECSPAGRAPRRSPAAAATTASTAAPAPTSCSAAAAFNDRADYGARTGGVTVTLDALADDGEAGEGDLVADDVEEVAGGAGDDVLRGSDGPNVLSGGPGADRIDGAGGDDVISGGVGNDELTGGPGADAHRRLRRRRRRRLSCDAATWSRATPATDLGLRAVLRQAGAGPAPRPGGRRARRAHRAAGPPARRAASSATAGRAPTCLGRGGRRSPHRRARRRPPRRRAGRPPAPPAASAPTCSALVDVDLVSGGDWVALR